MIKLVGEKFNEKKDIYIVSKYLPRRYSQISKGKIGNPQDTILIKESQ